jgi:hypothetical protein
MIRLRIAAIAAASSLAFVGVAAPVASAASGTGSQQVRGYNFPALYTVKVTGANKSGSKQFTGTFGIQRFVKRGGRAYAVGTLKGTLAGQSITRYGVMMPANLNQNQTATTSRAHAAATCPILNLTLGPIHLNLLGLVIDLGGGANHNQPIVLDITAVSGNGNLLGNLLCGVSNLLNQGGLLSQIQGDLSSLTALLNQVLGILSGL